MNYSDVFRYEDGNLYWSIKKRGLRHNRPIGWINKGYVWIRSNLFPKQLSMHRVIWEMHYGAIPTNAVIDHIDRNPLNNKIENLRIATRSQNSMNAKGKSGRKSNFPKNVYKDSEYNGIVRYRAQVCVNGKLIRVGGFKTVDDAEQAAIKLVKNHHGDFSFIKEQDLQDAY